MISATQVLLQSNFSLVSRERSAFRTAKRLEPQDLQNFKSSGSVVPHCGQNMVLPSVPTVIRSFYPPCSEKRHRNLPVDGLVVSSLFGMKAVQDCLFRSMMPASRGWKATRCRAYALNL